MSSDPKPNTYAKTSRKDKKQWWQEGSADIVSASTKKQFTFVETLTQAELDDLDASSDEDAFPVRTLLEIVRDMTTHKREQTLAKLRKLQQQFGERTPNEVVGVLSNVAIRPRLCREQQGLSKAERRQAHLIDVALQAEVLRRVRTWVQEAERHTQHSEDQHQRRIQHIRNSPGRHSRMSYGSLDEARTMRSKKSTTFITKPKSWDQVQAEAKPVMPPDPTTSRHETRHAATAEVYGMPTPQDCRDITSCGKKSEKL